MCRTRILTANELMTQYRNDNKNSNQLPKSRMSNKELNVINIESADRSASRTHEDYTNTFDRIDIDNDNEINIINNEEILIRSEAKDINSPLAESDLKVIPESKKNIVQINEDDQINIERRNLVDDFI